MIESPVFVVADDQSALRALTVATLRQIPGPPAVVHEAVDGHQAIELVREIQPDVVLMDWEMPGLDGVEATRALGQDESTHEIPVLILTAARRTTKNLRTALQAGATDFIRKPVDEVELLARCSAAIRLSRTLRRLRQRNAELEVVNTDLLAALDQIQTLSEFLSQCAHCRKVRADDGSWVSLEEMVREQTGSDFSHGLCPTCVEVHYPDLQLS